MDYQLILDEILEQARPLMKEGRQADYIPALAKVNPDQAGICLSTLDGKQYTSGQIGRASCRERV